MKEHDLIKTIKNLTNTNLIGDDCAYLKEFGIVVTQDNFVEDVHFKQTWATPYQIGYKAAAVNISDILASGAKPEYLTVGLSHPNPDEDFIKEFYRGVEAGSYGAKIAGGDLTGGKCIFISICAIGSTHGRKISSRSAAKAGYKVISKGKYGQSSAGLKELFNGGNNTDLIRAHLEPVLDVKFSEDISAQIQTDYAMMDTSDGLADALFQIAQASRITIKTNYIEGIYGAEDYHLVAAVPEEFLPQLTDYEIIGTVCEYESYYLKIGDKKYSNYDDMKLYCHFE